MCLALLLLAGSVLIDPPPRGATLAGDTVPVGAAHARASEPAGGWLARVGDAVGFSGFASMLGEWPSAAPGMVELEGLELHFGREFTRSVSAAAALLTTPDGITAPVVMLDLHVGGGLIAPRGRLPVERGFHLIAGRFDLPIGTDWELYAPVDRITVSAPLVTAELHEGGLNDWGVQAAARASWWRGVVLAARGADADWRAGGRVALAPFSNPYTFRRDRDADPLEIGVSLLRDLDGGTADTRWVLDASSDLGVVRAQGEVAWRDAAAGDRWRGWHVTADAPLLAAGPLALRAVGRVERATHDVARDGAAARMDVRRGTLGLRADVAGRVIVKLEWQRRAESAEGHDVRDSAVLVQSSVVF